MPRKAHVKRGRRRGRTRDRGWLPIAIIVIFALIAVAVLASFQIIPFTVAEKEVIGVKFRVEVTPDVPMKVTVNDYGKEYTFTVKVRATAPTKYSFSSIPELSLANYVGVMNPLKVPAVIKIPQPSIQVSGGMQPMAIALLDGQYLIYPKLSPTTATTSTQATPATPPGEYSYQPSSGALTSSQTTTTTSTSGAAPRYGIKYVAWIAPQEIIRKADGTVEVRYDGKFMDLLPGETKEMTFTIKRKVGAGGSLEEISIHLRADAYSISSGQLQEEGQTTVVWWKAFEAVPLSQGLHIQDVVTEASSGKVRYVLVNDWIVPLKVETGIIRPEHSQIISVGGSAIPRKTVTIQPRDKVTIEFVDEDVRAFFSNWRAGDPTTYTKKISACILPEGAGQTYFAPQAQCISAIATWKYNSPSVKISLQASGPGSVELYAGDKKIAPGSLVESGAMIRVKAAADTGYIVDRMEVTSPDGKLLYVENLVYTSQSEWVSLLKSRTWSFIADHSRASEYVVKVSFTRATQEYVYTTGTATMALGPKGEYPVASNVEAAAKTVVTYRVAYDGYAVCAKIGAEEVCEARGNMAIAVIVENTADRPIDFKDEIKLGGRSGQPTEKTITVSFQVQPKQKVEYPISFSLNGIPLTKPSKGSPYLPIEFYPMVKWADSPSASWVAAFTAMKIPQINFDTVRQIWSDTGGETYETDTVKIKVGELGVEYPELIIHKPENSLTASTSLGGTSRVAGYQPIETEIKRMPSGEKEKATMLIEPSVASSYDTNPGLPSAIPVIKKHAGSLLETIWNALEAIWNALKNFWEWLLSLFRGGA